MKRHLKNKILAMAFVFILFSCGDKSGNSTEVESEKKPTFTGGTVISMAYEIEDYATWVYFYNETSNADARISHYVNVDNPDEIILFELSESHKKAKEELEDVEKKEAMERAGVSTEREIQYINIKYMNVDAIEDQFRILVTHEVSDYDSWKESFDSGVTQRNKAGMTLRGIGTSNDNENMVIVFLSTNDLGPAREMVTNMKPGLIEAGVVSEPTVKFFKVPGSN